MTIRTNALLAAVGFLALALSGCIGGQAPPATPGSFHPRDAEARPTVIAVIDSGINPYHEAFRAEPGRGVEAHLATFGLAGAVRLADQGDHAARVAADDAFWANVTPGQLYAFEGTRVLGISISRFPGVPPLLDVDGHGTATAALAAHADPDAIVVAIQTDNAFCSIYAEYCPLTSPVSEAMVWAADQPWIDVISVSLGLPGNPPVPKQVRAEVEAYLEASRLAHQRGKLLVNGAGNTVVPPLGSSFAGPPWVIAVGGVEIQPKGETPDASKMPDVVANFTDYVPTHDSIDQYGWNSGTSLATPTAAGTLSRALSEVRKTLGHAGGISADGAMASGTTADGRALRVTSKDLRDALNATAVQFGPTDWDPAKPTSNRSRAFLWQSLPVVAGPVQMGWGYVNGTLAPDLAAWVLSPDRALPASKALTASYQAQYQATRESYWRAVMET